MINITTRMKNCNFIPVVIASHRGGFGGFLLCGFGRVCMIALVKNDLLTGRQAGGEVVVKVLHSLKLNAKRIPSSLVGEG